MPMNLSTYVTVNKIKLLLFLMTSKYNSDKAIVRPFKRVKPKQLLDGNRQFLQKF